MNREPEAPLHHLVRTLSGVISVDEYGQGRAVLLLHGIPGWRGTWARVAHALKDHHRLIVPDLIGFGGSSGGGDLHADRQADALIDLLRTLDVPTVDVVGFDFGGPIALRMYAKQPTMVRSLVLMASNTFVDTPVPPPLRVARVPVLGRLAFRVFFGRTGLSLLWLAAVRARSQYPFRRHREALRSPQGVRSTEWVFFESLRDLPGRYAEVQRTLARVTVPTTVLWSEGDPFFPLSVGRRLQQSIPGSTFATVAGVGHFIPEEDPVETTLQLRRHLLRSEPAP